jgi:hypothetical protein
MSYLIVTGGRNTLEALVDAMTRDAQHGWRRDIAAEAEQAEEAAPNDLL